MKVVWSVLIVLLALGMTYGLMEWLIHPAQARICSSGEGERSEYFRRMKAAAHQRVPIENTTPPTVEEEPESIEEPVRPVQSIEERGDAMLFEVDALNGMPFDDAVLVPFD